MKKQCSCSKIQDKACFNRKVGKYYNKLGEVRQKETSSCMVIEIHLNKYICSKINTKSSMFQIFQ